MEVIRQVSSEEKEEEKGRMVEKTLHPPLTIDGGDCQGIDFSFLDLTFIRGTVGPANSSWLTCGR